MARNQVTLEAIVCPQCGSKIAATRERCPRCRASLTAPAPPDPAVQAARSRRLMRAAAALIGVFVLAVGALWATTVAVPENPPAGTPHAAPATRSTPPAAAPERPRGVTDPGAEPPFLDPDAAGVLAYSRGDHARALEKFEEAIARNPEDAESLSNAGQVLVKLGRAAEALSYFERACAVVPGQWTYRFNLARALSVLQRWDDSITNYRHAQQLYPDDYITTFNLGLALHKKGDEAGAVEELKKAAALQPEDPSPRVALGISYEKLGKTSDAAAAYGEYLRLSPNAPDAEKIRARIAALNGSTAPSPSAPAAPSGM